MKRHLLIALSLLAMTLPVDAAKPKPRASVADQAALTNLCTDLGATAERGAIRETQGWSGVESLREITPFIAPFSEQLQHKYWVASSMGHATKESPEHIHALVAKICMDMASANQGHARELAAHMAKVNKTSVQREAFPTYMAQQEQPTPPAPYAGWLKICAAAGAQAERIVHARDTGLPLTRVLTIQDNQVEGAMGRFLNDMTVDIYKWTHWDRVQARQETETKCMALAPR